MVVYRVLSIYRVLPGFREFAVFEKSKQFFYIFFGWVLHRWGQGPGKGPNPYFEFCTDFLISLIVLSGVNANCHSSIGSSKHCMNVC